MIIYRRAGDSVCMKGHASPGTDTEPRSPMDVFFIHLPVSHFPLDGGHCFPCYVTLVMSSRHFKSKAVIIVRPLPGITVP